MVTAPKGLDRDSKTHPDRSTADLERIIQQKDAQLSACVCGLSGYSSSGAGTASVLLISPDLSNAASESTSPSGYVIQDPPVVPLGLSVVESSVGGIDGFLSAARVHYQTPHTPSPVPPTILPKPCTDLTEAAWPANIPPPELLHHFVDTVFNSVPLASRCVPTLWFCHSIRRGRTQKEPISGYFIDPPL